MIREADINVDENGFVSIEEGAPEGRHTVTEEEMQQ